MTPASGPLAGGTNVTITGTNFTNVTNVTIGGSALGSRTVVSPTQITGTTPAATNAGAADVLVTSSSHGGGTCTGCFTYNPAVTVTVVSPASGPLGGGTNVTITGTHFTNVTNVTIGGAELENRAVVNPTQITGTTPAATSAGAKDVVVSSSSHGGGVCSGCFTYNPAVAVTAVSPASGPVAGGTSVTITGTNFTDVTSVTIGGNELGNRAVVSPTQITGTTPAGASAGATNVVVTSSSHGSGVCNGCFTYNPVVTVTSITPGAGPLTGGTSVTIAGTNFVDVTSVTIGGTDLGGRTVVSATEITGTTPAAASLGATDVVVTSSSHGSGTCNGCFTYNPVVTVTTVDPDSGLLAGGTSVTITGTNFVDVTSVTIGGTDLGSRTVVSATEITGTTPAGTSPGATDVVVTSSSHGSGICSGCYSYLTLDVVARPLAAGGRHSCTLTSSGSAYCWGSNGQGQLGNGSLTNSSTPVAVSGDLTFSALATGFAHTCGLTSG
ncbi:MAG: IPT/TIG domain-containing protein, partial [Gemmatimonadetes bacterium]|nr:IPT/TIG domain-containing protein [Gemmatimonadota bacterium]